jgi:hypothetical protein
MPAWRREKAIAVPRFRAVGRALSGWLRSEAGGGVALVLSGWSNIYHAVNRSVTWSLAAVKGVLDLLDARRCDTSPTISAAAIHVRSARTRPVQMDAGGPPARRCPWIGAENPHRQGGRPVADGPTFLPVQHPDPDSGMKITGQPRIDEPAIVRVAVIDPESARCSGVWYASPGALYKRPDRELLTFLERSVLTQTGSIRTRIAPPLSPFGDGARTCRHHRYHRLVTVRAPRLSRIGMWPGLSLRWLPVPGTVAAKPPGERSNRADSRGCRGFADLPSTGAPLAAQPRPRRSSSHPRLCADGFTAGGTLFSPLSPFGDGARAPAVRRNGQTSCAGSAPLPEHSSMKGTGVMRTVLNPAVANPTMYPTAASRLIGVQRLIHRGG